MTYDQHTLEGDAPSSDHGPSESCAVLINPYLHFDGRCREAFEFYARTLGGTIEVMQTHDHSPMTDHAPPPGWRDRILHAQMTAGDAVLMGADVPPGQHQVPTGISVSISVESPAEAERIFAALSDGGQVTIPMRRMLWGLFGMTVDRYGTPWMVNCGGDAPS